MKVIIFGATGAVGHSVTKAAVRENHDVTLFVRNKAKLEALLGSDILSHCRVIEGDALESSSVREALRGHSAAINASGHAKDGHQFHLLFKGIVEAAAECLDPPKRLWMLGGVTALDVPGSLDTSEALNDLPILYRTPYRTHTENYGVLLSDIASSLDWSMMCPGVLYEVDQRPATAPAGPLHTFTDAAQISLPTWALSKWCPKVLVSLLAIRQLGSFTVGLADVADVIVGNLRAGEFFKKRVGLKRDPTSA
ncbi:g11069 [Coccomyxa elongata]